MGVFGSVLQNNHVLPKITTLTPVVRAITVEDDVSKEDLDSLNPIKLFSKDFDARDDFFDDQGNFVLAGFISRLLQYIFPLAGLVLFVMLVWGGVEMLTGAASKKNLDAGKQRIVAALIGFLLLFATYWIAQIVEYITGVRILG